MKNIIALILITIQILFTDSNNQIKTNEKKQLLNKFDTSSSHIIYKGITFVGDKYCPDVSFEDPLALESLELLKATGANWVAMVVTEYQDYVNSTDIYPLYEGNYIKNEYYVYKTESIQGLIKAINYSHQIGLNVMLKPHIDLSKEPKYDEIWRGNIGQNFTKQIEWDKWFESYEKFIVKYAQLAEILNVKMFSVSCELIATNKMETYWREIIRKIRNVYSGILIASANHDGEEYEKQWWHELDYIGVDAYYLPIQSLLLNDIEKNIEEMLEVTTQKLKILSEKYNKKIIITEIGFCSGNCTIKHRDTKSTLTDQYLQAYFYDNFIKIFSRQKFIRGFFWWAWNSDPYFGGSQDYCISPQYKMAEYVLRNHYGGNITQMNYTPLKKAKCLCTI